MPLLTAASSPTPSGLGASLSMPPVLASNNPIEHILDHRFFSIGPTEHPWGYFTMHIVTLLVGALITLGLLALASNAIETGPASLGNRRYLPRGRFAQVIELLVVVLRDQMLAPILGEKQTRRYLPFLLSLFFFILTMNLLGLIPFTDLQHLLGMHAPVFGGTPTANIAINAALATVVFVVIQIHSFRELGVKGFFEHLCGGKDLLKGGVFLLPVIPIILVVELLGLFIKPAALCIRLFANMVGGHTLMATLFMFGAMAYNPASTAGKNILFVGGISLVAGVSAVLLSFMELFVAFLQAFIFMFLTAVFISQMSHHDEHEHEGHADDHAHDHDPKLPVPVPAHAH